MPPQGDEETSGDNSDERSLAREPRDSVMLSATVERFGGGGPTKHRIRNLSARGVRIDQAANVPVGATVLVTVGALEAVGATVVWARDGSAGLRFNTHIKPEDARAKAALAPRATSGSVVVEATGAPKAGWISDIRNPYRK